MTEPEEPLSPPENESDTTLCSLRSRELGEPLAGTAVARTAVWIVLEHRGPWGAKAVQESDLPLAIKERLMAWEAELPGARVQLVRRSRRIDDSLLLWVGVSDLGASRLVRCVLRSADDLLSLPIPAWVEALRRGEPVEGVEPCTQPLVLVCTNGRRDVCCSKLGVPLAQALDEQPGLDVWHTTHLGGHRFAATLLHLPEGLCYGRVEPSEAPALAQALREGRLHRIDRLRGRTALEGVEQAAEAAWRERTGRLELDAVTELHHVVEGSRVRVSLRDREGVTHELWLEDRELGPSAPPSCGKPPEAVRGWFSVRASD
ncbi:sucrase ferredoxin [Paraliomyxa miuraensis]|uniref:sucrase ferredoxin n=1 Tax=Paraliomyxa miuraensis TaxID=376150 RepID=UPI002258764E|nr:sucrase ferredoxin [Paraliomyxa miuraensis]MCX4240903.1 sucrase ferredoxin [Paraliomyxa miuraensis]